MQIQRTFDITGDYMLTEDFAAKSLLFRYFLALQIYTNISLLSDVYLYLQQEN